MPEQRLEITECDALTEVNMLVEHETRGPITYNHCYSDNVRNSALGLSIELLEHVNSTQSVRPSAAPDRPVVAGHLFAWRSRRRSQTCRNIGRTIWLWTSLGTRFDAICLDWCQGDHYWTMRTLSPAIQIYAEYSGQICFDGIIISSCRTTADHASVVDMAFVCFRSRTQNVYCLIEPLITGLKPTKHMLV